MDMPIETRDDRKRVFQHLMSRHHRAATGDTSVRWLLLQAAHITGQPFLWPHLRVHVAMLVHAWRARDAAEVAGQIFRLALVPLGHLTQKLPLGNPGRGNVSAFAPMAVAADIRTLIAQSEQDLRLG